MTKEDDALEAAIIDQINAELGAAGISMKQFAVMIGRPYDSTRNYLIKERRMSLGTFLEMSSALGLEISTITSRARQRL